MSALSRACLRLAACAALRNATPAQDRVFDSRIGSVDGFVPDQALPVIAVYTEEDEGDALSAQNGGPPFRQCVSLILELTMIEAAYDDAGKITDITAPATDGELEAALDTLEALARIALTESYAPNSVLFRIIAKRAEHSMSIRFTEPKTSTRLAIRYVTYKYEVDDVPLLNFDASLTGLDRLPEPFRTIAKAWADDAPEKDIAKAIADQLTQPTVPLLKKIRLNPPDDPANSNPTVWTPQTDTPPTEPSGLPTLPADWNLQT